MRFALALLLMGFTCSAATIPRSAPEEVGLSSSRLKKVSAVLQRYIDQGEIAGAVSLVARKGRVVHLEAQGLSDLATRKPLTADAIFRLASMTKPVTSLAVMMLVEDGHFLLDDPVAKFLPEFKLPMVAVANAPNERAGAGYRLVPAARDITIRHLLMHTAGLCGTHSGALQGDAAVEARRLNGRSRQAPRRAAPELPSG